MPATLLPTCLEPLAKLHAHGVYSLFRDQNDQWAKQRHRNSHRTNQRRNNRKAPKQILHRCPPNERSNSVRRPTSANCIAFRYHAKYPNRKQDGHVEVRKVGLVRPRHIAKVPALDDEPRPQVQARQPQIPKLPTAPTHACLSHPDAGDVRKEGSPRPLNIARKQPVHQREPEAGLMPHEMVVRAYKGQSSDGHAKHASFGPARRHLRYGTGSAPTRRVEARGRAAGA
jgi:hypothetical protein